MRNLMIAMAACLALVATGCGGGAVKVVKLSDVDAALAKYEGDAKYDPFTGGEEGQAVGEEWIVTYGAVCPQAEEGQPEPDCPKELKQYEDLFKDAAVLLATVKQTRYILDGIAEGRYSAADVKPILDFATKKLPNLANDGQALVGKAQSMNPASDLAAHPFKIGAVVSGVAGLIGSVGEAVAEIPKLLESLAGLAG